MTNRFLPAATGRMGFLACLLALCAGSAAAQTPAAPYRYLGAWRIAEAQTAPWVTQENPADRAESRQLIGRIVVYTSRRILGPAPLACKGPVYEMREWPPEGLFQGGLTAPEQQADELGFRSDAIPTLETGCEGSIDFHFVDEKTALFALDNMIYTLRRQ